MKTCKLDFCNEPVRSRGYCHAHYERYRRGGDLTQPVKKLVHYATTREKLESNRTITESGCWEWSAGVAKPGYGMVRLEGKTALVHRAAYEEYVGPIPENREIDHQCRNRLCFNPEHLKAVTRKENRENLGLDPRNTSGYRGVSQEFGRKTWMVSVTHERKVHTKSGFATPEEANEYAVKLRNALYTNNVEDRLRRTV